ncbi:hypothetical protein [Arthrobacter mangrovi]|uniref:Uncharacterized protein n=1 Tax=Arthrobacter mangrovi TaxID=2966350 RepID=A0ABQ5MYV7_9MICC|nr:hypothetical protein [Arthrobacter mangrovi]GLB69124.1 hypothetical protein AHIS1636_35670 [Arthrobacter mangrovi]
MEWPPEQDWEDLLGQQVQIRKDGHLIRIGYVEDVTQTGDALWLENHGIDPRKLFTKADGYTATSLTAGLQNQT